MERDELKRALFDAYNDASRRKYGTYDQGVFAVNPMENINQLADDLIYQRYVPNRGIAFVIKKPVIREIFAAPFRDRVVHHLLFNLVADWWDRRFIIDSYSCRINKGTDFGVQRLQHHIRSVSENGKKKAYIIKLDIKSYFMSLPRKKLYERVVWGLKQQYVDDPNMLNFLKYVWRQIIFDDPTKDVKRRGPRYLWNLLPYYKSLFNQSPGIGIVIGNLTSQLLSNIYLDQLDRFIQFELGYEHYGRYVDDFYIVVSEAEFEQAKRDIAVIEKFLKEELCLTLHPKKRYIQEVHKGVEFLGKVVYPDIIVASKRFCKQYLTAAREIVGGIRSPDSLISYLGYGKHYNFNQINTRVFNIVGWDPYLYY